MIRSLQLLIQNVFRMTEVWRFSNDCQQFILWVWNLWGFLPNHWTGHFQDIKSLLVVEDNIGRPNFVGLCVEGFDAVVIFRIPFHLVIFPLLKWMTSCWRMKRTIYDVCLGMNFRAVCLGMWFSGSCLPGDVDFCTSFAWGFAWGGFAWVCETGVMKKVPTLISRPLRPHLGQDYLFLFWIWFARQWSNVWNA